MNDNAMKQNPLAEELEELQIHNLRVIAKAAMLEQARLIEEEAEAHPTLTSEEDLQKFLALAARMQRKQRLQHNLKKIYLSVSKVAVVLLIVIASGTLTVWNVEALRAPILNWLMEIHETHTSIQFLPEETSSLPKLHFQYLPEGFSAKLHSTSVDCDMYALTSDSENCAIYVDFFTADSPLNIDTEGASVTETMVQGQYPATLVEKDGYVQMVWTDHFHAYTIMGEYNPDEMKKIADGIEFEK